MAAIIQAFASQRTVFDETILPAIVVVKRGKIIDIILGSIEEKMSLLTDVSNF